MITAQCANNHCHSILQQVYSHARHYRHAGWKLLLGMPLPLTFSTFPLQSSHAGCFPLSALPPYPVPWPLAASRNRVVTCEAQCTAPECHLAASVKPCMQQQACRLANAAGDPPPATGLRQCSIAILPCMALAFRPAPPNTKRNVMCTGLWMCHAGGTAFHADGPARHALLRKKDGEPEREQKWGFVFLLAGAVLELLQGHLLQERHTTRACG